MPGKTPSWHGLNMQPYNRFFLIISMIKAVLLDFNGMVIRTEALLARSFTRATLVLSNQPLSEEMVEDAYRDVAECNDEVVSETLMRRFRLEPAARLRMGEFDVQTPREVFYRLKARFYHHMLADPLVLRNHLFPATVSLIQALHAQGVTCLLGSLAPEALVKKVLLGLSLEEMVVPIKTARMKKDRIFFDRVLDKSGLEPDQCLALLDTSEAIHGALEAGLDVIGIHLSGPPPPVAPQHILKDTRHLKETVLAYLNKKNIPIVV